MGGSRSERDISTKGMAPIIATLLLIVISVVGSGITYEFVTNYVAEGTATQPLQSVLLLESVETTQVDVRKVFVRNIGLASLTIDRLYLSYSQGPTAGTYPLESPREVAPGHVVELALPPLQLLAPKTGYYYIQVNTKEGIMTVSQSFMLKLLYLGKGSWREYAGNPVFDPASKAYYPYVIYDAGQFGGHGGSAYYKMWFGSDTGVGYAYSADGMSWTEGANPVSNLTNANHPVVRYFPDGFHGRNSGNNPSGSTMYYRIWYWDTSKIYTVEAIRYAESPDGVNWYNDQPLQNGIVPIVTGTWPDWNYGSYGPCDVLYNPGASNTGTDWKFTMYYDGTTGGNESIGVAFSSDGVTWTGYDHDGDGKADPVLTGSGSGWDYDYVSRCTILKVGSRYHMWFSGGVGRINEGIGYATSSDGLIWTKDANNPVFHKTDGLAWRSDRTYCPMVIEVNGTFKMFYAGKDSSGNYAVGYAVAP
ncbi:MAG: hypothetical protein ACP5KV_02495 [Candidatus Methanomethylicaceae archaeon]